MTGTTVALGHWPARRRRGFTVGVAAGALLPIAMLLAFSLVPRDTSQPTDRVAPEVAEQRQALTAFLDKLEPVTTVGAATVVYGMRPGINDIYDQRFDDETLVTMAAGWVKAMERAGRDFAAIEPPSFLSEATRLYAASFDAYLETARALHAAAGATGQERADHIAIAGEHGTRADRLYDAAKAEVQRHRERLGMGVAGIKR